MCSPEILNVMVQRNLQTPRFSPGIPTLVNVKIMIQLAHNGKSLES